jgi:hypothetical protein
MERIGLVFTCEINARPRSHSRFSPWIDQPDQPVYLMRHSRLRSVGSMARAARLLSRAREHRLSAYGAACLERAARAEAVGILGEARHQNGRLNTRDGTSAPSTTSPKATGAPPQAA